MSRFQEALRSGRFLVTVELDPPKGTRLDHFKETLKDLSGRVDAATVPDNRRATICLNTLASALMAKENGLEPIYTLCCRDRNRLALSADLLGAYAAGIRNILCVTGDHPVFGDAKDAKPVFDLDSVQALLMIREMEGGKDIGGNDLEGSPSFCTGCVANPQASPLAPHTLKLEKKLSAGVEFIQTLDIFDLEKSIPFFEYMKDKDVKILAGVRLVTERETALAEQGRWPGNPIPPSLVEEIKAVEDPGRGVEKAAERMAAMISKLKESGLCHGVHLTLDGNERMIPDILKAAGL